MVSLLLDMVSLNCLCCSGRNVQEAGVCVVSIVLNDFEKDVDLEVTRFHVSWTNLDNHYLIDPQSEHKRGNNQCLYRFVYFGHFI